MGVVKNTELDVVVKNLLKTIAITTPPDETAYEIGETISLAGMVLEAYYSDGSSKVVNNYTYSPQTVSSNDDTEITISYTEDGITKTTIQEITIGNTPNLTGISIITNPDKMTYRAGEFFDNTGIVVAVLGMIGALGGSWIANRKNMALIEYRLKQLEEKVNKHNSLIERTYQLEKQVAIIQEEIKE